jgi:hypothetical protein
MDHRTLKHWTASITAAVLLCLGSYIVGAADVGPASLDARPAPAHDHLSSKDATSAAGLKRADAEVLAGVEHIGGRDTYATITLTPDQACYDLDALVTVTIDLSDVGGVDEIIGGQFRLQYDPTLLTFNSAAAADSVFTNLLHVSVDDAEIDLIVGVPGDPPGPGALSGTMAVLTFTAHADVCNTAELVSCRADAPPAYTRLSGVSDGSVIPIQGTGLSKNDLPAITVNDTTDPTVAAPPTAGVECAADVPPGATAYAEFVAAGGTASDNCTPADELIIAFVDGELTDPCDGTITRTYTITDLCGNLVEVQQLITVHDDANPQVTAPPTAGVECAADAPPGATAYAEFVAAGGTASDNCTPADELIIAFLDGELTDPCGGTITRTYTITDLCGNFAEVQQLITVDDITPPTFDRPADISLSADAGTCDTLTLTAAEIGWPTNLADNCSDVEYLEEHVTWERSDAAVNLDDPFTEPVTTITWRVTDACGNYLTEAALTQQTIMILPTNELVVNMELNGALSGTSLTRCVTFWVVDCDGSTDTFEEELTFTDGLANDVTLLVECGTYDCIMVEDGLHTLRRRLEYGAGFAIEGTQYAAGFTGGNGLVQGDLYNDLPGEAMDVIDILDFGVYITQWGQTYGPVTCATEFPHADLNGDGLVDVTDFSFIQLQFFQLGDPACCTRTARADGATRAAPLMSISVAELRQRGLDELALADLNGDDVLDLDDVLAFLSGARPRVPKPTPFGKAEIEPTPSGGSGSFQPSDPGR